MSRFLSRKLIGAITFVAIVIVSGVILAQSGNVSNPFSVVSQITGLASSTGQDSGTEGASRMQGQPPSGDSGTMPEGLPEGGERGDQSTFQWSRLGSVLFNLWFIAAVSAVVIIVGRPLGSILKRLGRGDASIRAKAVS